VPLYVFDGSQYFPQPKFISSKEVWKMMSRRLYQHQHGCAEQEQREPL
jgi:hypothetical protein